MILGARDRAEITNGPEMFFRRLDQPSVLAQQQRFGSSAARFECIWIDYFYGKTKVNNNIFLNNNYNNNNSKTMFMVLSSWQSHCESSPGSFDECRTAASSRRSKTKPDDLGCESACTGCQSLHPPSPFIIITQPESWYSFYRLIWPYA